MMVLQVHVFQHPTRGVIIPLQAAICSGRILHAFPLHMRCSLNSLRGVILEIIWGSATGY